MAVNKITKRWLLNSFGIILFILVTVVIVSSVSIKTFFYSTVRQELSSRSKVVSTLMETVANDSADDFSTEVRSIVESFTDADKIELMAIGSDGKILITSSGFATSGDVPMPDYDMAVSAVDGIGYFDGDINSENVMALSVLTSIPSDEISGMRYMVSLEDVDRHIVFYIAIITLICVFILFFVITTSSYFINSIVRPVEKVSETARRIAQGDFKVRLKKSNNDDEVGDLCDTINHMAEELSQNEQMKNDFISSVSHELRTPLTAIKGWAETLNDEGIDPLTKKGMKIIISETERLSQMVEELLDFSRIQSGRFKLNMSLLDIIAELSDAVLMYTERVKREDMTLIYDEPDYIATVHGDRNRLRQVFVNIIDNAIKYSNVGDTITISVARLTGSICIKIADTGCGISENDLPKVKSKFYKANSTRRGSGIGLAVADEIIAQHGGTLELDSIENVGTTVTISIPSVDNV